MQEHLSQIKICKPGTYICKQAKLINKDVSQNPRVWKFIKNIHELPVSGWPLITGRKSPDYRLYFKCF